MRQTEQMLGRRAETSSRDGAVLSGDSVVSTAREATYYFDSKACKKKFDEQPEKYIEK